MLLLLLTSWGGLGLLFRNFVGYPSNNSTEIELNYFVFWASTIGWVKSSRIAIWSYKLIFRWSLKLKRGAFLSGDLSETICSASSVIRFVVYLLPWLGFELFSTSTDCPRQLALWSLKKFSCRGGNFLMSPFFKIMMLLQTGNSFGESCYSFLAKLDLLLKVDDMVLFKVEWRGGFKLFWIWRSSLACY